MVSKTALGVPRTNANSIKWGAVAGAVVAVATALSAALSTGVIKAPPALDEFLPWLVFVLTIIITVGAALGIPSYHTQLSANQSHTADDPKH